MRTDTKNAASAIFAANRARGAVRFDVHLLEGVTRRRHLHESGSLSVRFPSPEGEGLSAVFVNTAGGIAGGDRFDIDIATGEGSRLAVTTAAAEKVYRTDGPAAELNIALKAAAGSHLAWLPQETILFDRARVLRRIDIDLEKVTERATRMRVSVSKGDFFATDGATGLEIVLQTAQAVDNPAAYAKAPPTGAATTSDNSDHRL